MSISGPSEEDLTDEVLGARLPPEGKEDTSEDGSQTNISNASIAPKSRIRLASKHLSLIEERVQVLLSESSLDETHPPCNLSELSELSSEDIGHYLAYLVWKKQENFRTLTKKLRRDSQMVKLALKTSLSRLELPTPPPSGYTKHMDERITEVDECALFSGKEISLVTKETKDFQRLVDLIESREETIYKVFKAANGSYQESDRRSYIIICSSGIYFVPKEIPDVILQSNCIFFKDLESILVGAFNHWIVIRSRDRQHSMHVDIGDCQTTKQVLSSIEICGRRQIETLKFRVENSRKMSWAPCFERMHNEVDMLEEALRKSNVLDSRTSIIRSWFALRENGEAFEMVKENSFCIEGHFMLKIPGIFSKWKPAYFILTEKVLYHFSNVSDEDPKCTVSTDDIVACEEIPQSVRPHSFQIQMKNGRSLQLGSPDQISALHWRQKILHLITHKPVGTPDRYVTPSYVVLTTSGLLMLNEMSSTCISRLYYKNGSQNKRASTSTRVRPSRHLPSLHGYDNKLLCRRKDSDVISNVTSSHFESASLQSCDTSRTATPRRVKNPSLGLSSSESPTTVPEETALRISSSVYLDQISSINVSEMCPAACTIELECIDALVVVHDWVLHFRTDQELSSFLHTTSKYYKEATYKKESIIRQLAPNLNQFLIEGYALASDYWDFN